MDMHYCKDELKSFSLFGKAKSCHEGQVFCPVHGKWMKMGKKMDSEDVKSCCSNKTIQFDDLDKDYTLAHDLDLFNIHVKILTAFVFTMHEGLVLPKSIKSEVPNIEPPLSTRDIYVLYESFLI